MIEQPSRTLVCSIVFLDIVDYSTKPVAEQLLLKQSFNRLLSSALENVPPRDRVVLDTGDGAGITFLGDPEDALFVAMSLRAAARAESSGAIAVRIGINLGPVRLVKDINGQMNIIGDGINVAQRIMNFAQAGQLLVSRSFYEVVSCLSLDYASLFSYVGARTDKHVREHEVYAVGIGTDAARRVLETGTRRALPRRGTPRLIGELTDIRPFGVHRMALLGAPLAFALLVGGGVAVKAQMNFAPLALEPPPVAEGEVPQRVALKEESAPAQDGAAAPAPAKTETSKPAAAAAVRTEPASAPSKPKASVKRAPPREGIAAQPAPPSAAPAVEPAATPSVQVAAAPARGTLELSILPWGEVFIDGKSRGVSPPLRALELAAGAHTIEIRNTTFPVHTRRVEVRAGEPVRIRHRFR
jgi:class 3 adenylate cyclase